MHKHLKYHGMDATVRNFTKTGEDNYGDPNYSESETDTKVITKRVDNLIRSVQEEYQQDARSHLYMYLDLDIEVHDGTKGDVPSEIDVAGRTYEVSLVDDEEVGLVNQRQGKGLTRILVDQMDK